VFEAAECEAVMNSTFFVQRYEKHENEIKSCAVQLKVRDWKMNTWTSWACDRWARYGRWLVYNVLKVKEASFNLIRHSMGSQCQCKGDEHNATTFGLPGIFLYGEPLANPYTQENDCCLLFAYN